MSNTSASNLQGMQFDDGQLYGNTGYVVDTRYSTPTPIGLIRVADQYSYKKVGLFPDSRKSKVFVSRFSDNYTKLEFLSFNSQTFVKNKTIEIPIQLAQGFSSPSARSLVRVGKAGLATIVFEDYSFGKNIPLIVIANDLDFVDSTVSSTPRPIWYDTISVKVYDTIVLQTNDTLVFPMLVRLGEQESLLASFKVFPNPSSEYLTVTLANQLYPYWGSYSIALIDMEGKHVAMTSVNHWGGSLYVGGLPKGSYILEIVNFEYNTSVRKHVIIN